MLAFLIASALAAEVPAWFHGQTLERNGTVLRVVCVGTALSLDLAREEANRTCQAEAIRQVQSDLNVRSESVESEHDAVLHQEIRSTAHYSGMVCKPERESVQTEGDQTTVYLECRFDLAKIRATTVPDKPTVVSLIRHTDAVTEEVPEIPITQEKGYRQGAERHILMSSVPGPCHTIVINGKRPARVIRCTENPQVITVDTKNDTEVIIRPEKNNLMPKRILLGKEIPSTLEVQYEDR